MSKISKAAEARILLLAGFSFKIVHEQTGLEKEDVETIWFRMIETSQDYPVLDYILNEKLVEYLGSFQSEDETELHKFAKNWRSIKADIVAKFGERSGFLLWKVLSDTQRAYLTFCWKSWNLKEKKRKKKLKERLRKVLNEGNRE
jgi:hypothetical protein